MVRRSNAYSWVVAVCGIVAFVAGASAQSAVRPSSQGVVTPGNPIFAAQDPAPAPAPETPETPETPDTPSPTPPATAPAAAQGPGPQQGPGGQGRGRGQRTYAQLTAEAKTDDGLFKVHRIGDNIYFEIPKAALGKDLLWVTSIKRTTLGAGYGGSPVADRVVRWERQAGRVFLRVINYDVVADPSQPIARAVADANTPAIVRAFNVMVSSPDDDPVIDVTALLMGEIAEFSPRANLGARGMDQSRSYLEKVVSFPENINVQVTQTYTSGAPGAAPAPGRVGMRGTSGTISLFHSLVKLPETPMQSRLFDSRVGYFTNSTYDFGRDEHRAVEREYITRYRLEKKDPDAAESEPVKPIVYYIDPATPTKLVPYVKKGIEDWQPAFEAAGFSNAIVAKDAPDIEEDPDWDPEDVRYSVVRWLPSTVENAQGPHVADPRSGEILEADVLMYHNVQNLAAMWYVSQVGALDPRAQKLPLPDDLIGELVRFIVAHEIGHTLGFRHNMRASSMYTIEQIRDPRWVRENGHTPSIMDYARFNYVAQPEDGIAVADLVPKVGAYDKWATRWGYAPIPSARTPDEERPTLDAWAREQETTPSLRFMTSGESEAAAFPFDPGQQREAVGDSDPVRATELGLRNIRRVANQLVTIASRPGEPWDDLRELYGRVVAQWRLELGHVSAVVGGTDSRELYVGQPGVRFTPVPRARQAAAVAFLLENGFKTPAYFVQPDLLRRIEPAGVVGRISVAQTSLMNALLQPARLERMVEQAVVDPTTYTPLNLLTDLRGGIWRELTTPVTPIDLYRRNVQRAYLDTIDARLNSATAPNAEVRSLLRGELRVLDQQIARALPAVTDVATRRHLQDARETISTVLDPRAMRVRGGAAAAAGARGLGAGPLGTVQTLTTNTVYDFEADPFLAPPEACWPDLRVD
jgi:hypothetical protein